MDRRAFRLWFAAIVAGAALVRVLYVIGAKVGEPVVGDQIYYSGQAATIADGGWFSDPFVVGEFAADHPPLTALALAPASWDKSDPYFAQRLLMAGYGVLVVIGVGMLARWLFGRRVALAATALAGVYANFWMNDGLIMSETLATGAVVGVLGAVYVYDLRRTLAAAAWVGGAIGIAGLVRAELLLLGPLVVVPLMLVRRHDRAWPDGVRDLAVAAGLAVTVIAPWVVRNQLRFDDTTLITTQDGLTLVGSYCPPVFSGPGKGFWELRCADLVEVPDGADPSVRSSHYRAAAFDFARDHLDELPGVAVARLGRGFSLWRVGETIDFNVAEGRERWASTIGVIQYWLLLPLAIWGWRTWPSRQPRWPAMATAALPVIVIAALYGLPRFRIPAEVVIVLGAAVALESIRSRAAPDR